MAAAADACEMHSVKGTGLTKGCTWMCIPASLAISIVGWSKVLAASTDATTTVMLFLGASLFVAALIDEGALHALVIHDQQIGLPRLLCVLNWIMGGVVIGALLRVTDLRTDMNDQLPELYVTFVGLTYFTFVFGFACAHSKWAKDGLYVGAVGPILVYAILVAFVVIQINSATLPFVLTTDAALALCCPLLHAFALGPRAFPSGMKYKGLDEAVAGDSHESLSVSVTLPRVAYGSFLGVSLWLASPQTVAVLLNDVPQRMLTFLGTLNLSTLALDDMASVAWRDVRIQLDSAEIINLSVPQSFLLAYALIGVLLPVLLLRYCCCGPTRADRVHQTGVSSTDAALARKRLTKLRAASKLFPPPYPNGWHMLCTSDEVPTGHAIAASACNKEFAVFRGQDGKIAVLHAFCPHLGTHLGHGGKVSGNSVVCPYHSWAFNAEGKCTDIPYCPKQPTARTNTTAYVARERLGLVFVWLHADNEPPEFELSILDEIEEKNMRFVMQVPVERWQMHAMEPSQNAADPYHFNTTHSWLGAEDGKRSWLWVQHECKTRLALLGHKGDDGKPLDDTLIVLDERCTDMRLFGLFPFPKLMNAHYSSGASFQGPQNSIFRVDSPFIGSLRVLFCFTPEAPFEQRCACMSWCTPGFPQFLARWITKTAVATVNQDRKVWEHKLAVAPRNVVSGDGPFATYGTWLQQFYSKSSSTWGDMSLEW